MRAKKGLTFDDVLLIPKCSPVESRSDVKTDSVVAGDVSVSVPIISANMDTVTETEMAESMANNGAFSIIHRYMSYTEQANMINSISNTVGASVGVNVTQSDITLLENAGAALICFDIAHCDLEHVHSRIEEIVKWSNVPVVAGNVATYDAAERLSECNVDAIKVGIGPGSACITREVTGAGVPQITAISDVANFIRNNNPSIKIIADGGIRKSGDIVKALMAGADTVMIGGMFSRTEEAPGNTFTDQNGNKYKEFRGMASNEARNERNKNQTNTGAVEGVSTKVPVDSSVQTKITKLQSGIKSGLSYCGGHTIEQARKNHEFIETSNATTSMNSSHSI